MKKNWIIFILIVVASYAWVINGQLRKSRAYQEELKTWKAQDEIRQAEQAKLAEEKAALKAEAAKLVAAAAAGTTTTTPVADSRPGATISAEPTNSPRELLRRLGDPNMAPLHTVETPLYKVVLSELGAVPVDWEIKSSEFVINIAEDSTSHTITTMPMIPQFGGDAARNFPLQFVGSTVRDLNRQMYTVTRKVEETGTRLTFLSDPLPDGLQGRKEFFFSNETYVVDLHVTIDNPVGATTRQRLGRDNGFGIGWEGGFGNPTMNDRVHGSMQTVYATADSVSARTLSRGDQPYEVTNKMDWAGEEKKFFAGLLIPSQANPPKMLRIQVTENAPSSFFEKGISVPMDVLIFHESQDLDPGQSATLDYQVFVGPKSREALAGANFTLAKDTTEPGRLVFHQIPLGMTFMRWLALRLLDMMRWLHDHIGVWGLSIICTTLLVRILIYPITHWSIKNTARTMVEQEKIRPELQAINKKYKSDPMKRNQAMMALYREHNINPVAGPLRGCLPALLQMPIFLALYVVFEQSVELRGQSFLWIDDLSRPDALINWGVNLPLIGHSLNVLPIIMGFTNYFLMAVMRMPAADEAQEKIQKQMTLLMPIMMVFFLYHMPAGLTLYWTVSNIFSIGQSVMTKRLMLKHKEEHAARMSNKNNPKTNDVTVETSSTTIR